MPPIKGTPNKDEKPAESVEVTPQVPEQHVEKPAENVTPQSEQNTELKSVEDVTHEVLGGRWGATAADSMAKLEHAGYDVDAVWAEVQRRKAGGAPSAF